MISNLGRNYGNESLTLAPQSSNETIYHTHFSNDYIHMYAKCNCMPDVPPILHAAATV